MNLVASLQISVLIRVTHTPMSNHNADAVMNDTELFHPPRCSVTRGGMPNASKLNFQMSSGNSV